MRNAALNYAITAEYIWLLALVLHVYRSLVEERRRETRPTTQLAIGLLAPTVTSIGTFLLSSGCSLALDSLNLWLVVTPGALLCLLAFYAAATSALVARSNAQYEMIAAKLRLRRLLLWLTLLVSRVDFRPTPIERFYRRCCAPPSRVSHCSR